MKADVYTVAGKKTSTVDLPETLFGLPWHATLVHQVVVAMQANARTPVAHTKDRSDVAGGGRKPWRQKGTGRARHGSIRSPLWRTGGVTFGPRNEKQYGQKINRRVRAKALMVALSQKVRDGELLFVDTLGIEEPKASRAREALASLSSISGFDSIATKKNNSTLIALTQQSAAIVKSFSNFGNVAVTQVTHLNPVDVLTYKHLVIVDPSAAIEQLSARIEAKKQQTAA